MCIIIDANISHRLVQNPLSDDAAPVVEWLEKRGGRLVTGGKNAKELFDSGAVRRWVMALRRAGRAEIVPDAPVAAEGVNVAESGLCVSDDEHIISLARVARVRLVYSSDKKLHVDFRNPALLSNPRGSIYQTDRHKHLLKRNCPKCAEEKIG